MTLIPNWSVKRLHCWFCGDSRSTKYNIEIRTADGEMKTVCVCNRCALRYAREQED